MGVKRESEDQFLDSITTNRNYTQQQQQHQQPKTAMSTNYFLFICICECVCVFALWRGERERGDNRDDRC